MYIKETPTCVLVGVGTIDQALTKSSPSRSGAGGGGIGSNDLRSLHLEIVPQGNDPRRHRMCFGVPEHLHLGHSGPVNGGLARVTSVTLVLSAASEGGNAPVSPLVVGKEGHKLL